MRRSSAAVLTAALVLAFGVASAQGVRQTPGSNIAVTQCSPHRHDVSYPGHPWIDPYGIYHGPMHFPTYEGYLAITYTNKAAVAATEVDFGLVARRSMIAIVKDVGTFSPAISIDHEFSLDPQVFPIGTALPFCEVLRVKYANGTVWNNPHATVDI